MACVNIIDHRNHSVDPKCDAVIETVNPNKKKTLLPNWVPDVTILTRTSVQKVLHQAHERMEDVCVCLYDWGTISKAEIKEVQKSQNKNNS